MSHRTPVTPAGLRRYDHLDPAHAIVRAWNDLGAHPAWHLACKDEVSQAMPLLARAVSRLAASDAAVRSAAEAEAHRSAEFGNVDRRHGVDRCAGCGCKYWVNDTCIDCGGTVPREED